MILRAQEAELAISGSKLGYHRNEDKSIFSDADLRYLNVDKERKRVFSFAHVGRPVWCVLSCTVVAEAPHSFGASFVFSVVLGSGPFVP